MFSGRAENAMGPSDSSGEPSGPIMMATKDKKNSHDEENEDEAK